MKDKILYWRFSLIAIILLLGSIIFLRMFPLFGGLMGALTAYILARGQMFWLVEKRHWKRGMSALLVVSEFIMACLIPLGVFTWIIIGEVQNTELVPDRIIGSIKELALLVHERTGYNILGDDSLSFIVSQLSHWGQLIMEALGSLGVNLFVMVLVLYFMLIGGKEMETYLFELLPFSTQNTQEVLCKIKVIVRSNAIGIPLQAIIQGGIATLGYWIFGVSDILLLGVLTSIATVIPIVGTTLVWLPISLFFALGSQWFNAIGMFLYGTILIGQSDNVIRLILQKRMADTHPLITLLGVIIGLPLFGFMGIIFGPLLLSLFLLLVDIFKREYISGLH